MMPAWMTPCVLMATPVLGSVLCLLGRSSLDRMKTYALFTTIASFAIVTGLPWVSNESLADFPLLLLLPTTAFLSLLGQSRHPRHRLPWVITLLLLGLGQGILTSQEPARSYLLELLLGVLCSLLVPSRSDAMPETWRGLTAFGLGFVSILLTLVLPPPASTVAGLIACATLLPLFPLHGGFVAALTRLPGNLPAFAVVLLPLVGFESLLRLLPTLTATTLQTVTLLALVGACHGSLQAWIQPHSFFRVAYAGLAFFSLLWWFIADTVTAPPEATVFLVSTGLATSGLLLGYYAIRARYGDIDLRALGGMAYHMPRFSTLLALLALAALGMPPFGVYAGFAGMLLSPGFAPSRSLFLIMIVWLGPSWYFIELIQWPLFGRSQLNLKYEDLHRSEFVPLVIILVLLLAFGTAPWRLFHSEPTAPKGSIAFQAETWIP